MQKGVKLMSYFPSNDICKPIIHDVLLVVGLLCSPKHEKKRLTDKNYI